MVKENIANSTSIPCGSNMEQQNQPAVSFFGEGVDDAECSICLQTMPRVTWNGRERITMYCCGNFYCRGCKEKAQELIICPICSELRLPCDRHKFQHRLRHAQSGKPWAQYSLVYEEGKGVEIDLDKAAYWFKAAAKQNVLAAMYRYGLCLEREEGNRKSKSGSIYWIEKAANIGFPPAQLHLGKYYIEENCSEQNKEKGIRLVMMSSDQGNVEAMAYLASCYLQGTGVENDESEALRLCTLATETSGCPAAQLRLGIEYRDAGNFDQFMYWTTKAANQNHPDALHELGSTLVDHALTCTDEDCHIPSKGHLSSGLRKLRKAARLGNTSSIQLLAETEGAYSSHCANCNKEQSADNELMKCAKCQLMYYCSRECQKEHWRSGHKNHC